MRWWNRKFKACSFAVKMSSFRSAISVYKFVFCSYFLCFSNSKNLHQKETLSQVFSGGFCKVLRTLLQNTSGRLLLKLLPRIYESLAGCRTMIIFAVFCKIGALERNAYWFHVKLIFIVIFSQSFKSDVRA